MEFECAHIKLGLKLSARIESCRKPDFTAITDQSRRFRQLRQRNSHGTYINPRGGLSAREAVQESVRLCSLYSSFNFLPIK